MQSRTQKLAIVMAAIVLLTLLFFLYVPQDQGYDNPQVLASSQWLEANMMNENVRILEIGTDPSDFETGHIPGSAFIEYRNLTDQEASVEGLIPRQLQLEELLSSLGVRRNQTVVFYDRLSGLFAAWAFYVLDYYDHSSIKILNGGWDAWTKTNGNSSDRQTRYYDESTYSIGLQEEKEIRADADFILSHLDDPEYAIVDTRSYEEYTGETAMSERGGHIPGAINIEWSESTYEDSSFKSASELLTIYESKNVTKDKRIVTYCQKGVRGSLTWFVLHHLLGYPDVRLYDGSWEEWGNNNVLPVETGGPEPDHSGTELIVVIDAMFDREEPRYD